MSTYPVVMDEWHKIEIVNQPSQGLLVNSIFFLLYLFSRYVLQPSFLINMYKF